MKDVFVSDASLIIEPQARPRYISNFMGVLGKTQGVVDRALVQGLHPSWSSSKWPASCISVRAERTASMDAVHPRPLLASAAQ